MTTGTTAVASTTEAERAIATLTTAFASDPITRWAFKDPLTYITYFPRFVVAMAGAAFSNGTAHAAERFSGVALWLPPGVHSDEETMGALAVEAVPPGEQEEVFGFMEQMGPFHPTEPHWYLPLIGVDPAQQGHGCGSALLSHALRTSDRDGLPAYLEATSSRGRALYERHGFEALGVIEAGSSPPMWPMLRKPR